MGRELYEFAAARRVFEDASSATGVDIARLCFESDEDTLRRTENSQIALFTVSIAALAALHDKLPHLNAAAVAGHSVGEYAALVAAGVVRLADAATLVQSRGRAMQAAADAHPGAMAALIGINLVNAKAACNRASGAGIVAVANDNSPGQVVISGERDAVNQAAQFAQQLGAKRVINLNVAGGFHSPIMLSAADAMNAAIHNVRFHRAVVPVYANVTAEPVAHPAQWRELLPRQIIAPVRWRETVLAMRQSGIEWFIECGVGEVLTGLLKRIDPDARGFPVADSSSLAAAVQELKLAA